ncbi:MAG: S41 family peptidase [Tetragenococcus koreensis]|nr:S41 family peptidase [Tetragenococcus koreensis]MDN6264985.1 S41 family peptidase [Tetragenococcus halophilus]MDN6383889.1 S41 family peptidase [Tetragenococcus koreensis]MDN6422975.1 S41 family peptidase [Tetragenococcus koreensis]MDN6503624.1 S41 family peptidase [Tetragenococcus halophilus]
MKIVLCSGRSITAILPYIDVLKLNNNQYSIAFNGATIFQNSSLELLQSLTLSDQQLQTIYTFLISLKVPISVDISTLTDVFELSDFSPSNYQQISHNFLNFHKIEFDSISPNLNPTTLIITGDCSDINQVSQNIPSVLTNLFSVVNSRSDMVEFLPKQANKLMAAQNVVQADHNKLSNIIFFGNNESEVKKESSQFKAPTSSVKDNILYVHLPEFSGSSSQGEKYANTIYYKMTSKIYKGIIIDLSNNLGGDIGPMLAGISPVIPNGKLFEIVNAANNPTSVTFRGSVTNNMGTKIDLGNVKKVTGIPVAVILNRWTASSGELTALALENNPSVKTFGGESAGYTSINDTYIMYNGAQVNITTSKIKKNNGQILFNNKIKPDVQTNNPIVQANNWILNQN